MIFETARLVVRPWTVDEAEQAFAIYSDEDVTRYLGGGRPHPDVAASRAWIERMAARNASFPPGLGLWAAYLKGFGPPIGSVLLLPLDGGPEIELGYHLGKSWWGQGYATELACGGVRYGFEVLGLKRIAGVTFPENVASQRVLTKAGLRHEGRGQYFGHELEYFAIDAPATPARPTWG
jgi:ribosomal-protein-alanine N-acetyltransferase